MSDSWQVLATTSSFSLDGLADHVVKTLEAIKAFSLTELWEPEPILNLLCFFRRTPSGKYSQNNHFVRTLPLCHRVTAPSWHSESV